MEQTKFKIQRDIKIAPIRIRKSSQYIPMTRTSFSLNESRRTLVTGAGSKLLPFSDGASFFSTLSSFCFPSSATGAVPAAAATTSRSNVLFLLIPHNPLCNNPRNSCNLPANKQKHHSPQNKTNPSPLTRSNNY